MPTDALPAAGDATEHFFLRGLIPARRPSLLAATLAMHLLGLALPLLSLQVYDRILRHHAVETLGVMVAGVVVAIFVESVLRLLRQSVIQAQEAAFGEAAHHACLEHLLHLQPTAAAGLSPAEAVQQLSAIERMKARYGGETYLACIEAVFLLLYLGLLGWLAGWLALVPGLLIAAFGFAAWRLGCRLQMHLRALETQDDRRYQLLTEILSSLHTVKAAGRELALFRRCEAEQEPGTLLAHRAAGTALQLSALGQLTAQAMLLSMMTVGAWMAVKGHITTGALVACVLLAGRLMQPVQRMLSTWARRQEEQVARRRLQVLGRLPRQPVTLDLGKSGLGEPSLPEGRLEAREIHFRYAGQPPLLRGLSLALAPGEMLAIHAASNRGTTSLLRLLGGQLMPDAGAVRLDGIDPAHLPDEALCARVAYLPAEPVILRGSVMDNLTAFAPEKRSEALWIAEQLGMLPAITRLPGGWDTPLEGSESDSIPPGLRQRITIARALLPRPKLILFDQADRALDTESYNAVFRLLGAIKGHASILLVSEDANLLRLADRRVGLQEGRLVPWVVADLRPHTPLPLRQLMGAESVLA